MWSWLRGRLFSSRRDEEPVEESDEPPGEFVPLSPGEPRQEAVLPAGDGRFVLASKMPAEDAIRAFMSKCGFDGYHLDIEDDWVASARFENGEGVDLMSLPYEAVTPADLQGWVFFQIYAAGDETRRENDAYFARGMGYFGEVTWGMDSLVITATGALWREPDSSEVVSIEVRPDFG